MLSNIHTHTNLCDGKSAPEEIVLAAINQGFRVLGFSEHGYTPFDTSYCLTDTQKYIDEIHALKEKYKNDIQIYCGIEEDSLAPVRRSDFDYIIGSAHYMNTPKGIIPVDHTMECTGEILEQYENDPIKMAEAYYGAFCDYIQKRKPDVIGHFDLITKFDEQNKPLFLGNNDYERLAESYIKRAAKSGCIFEINTGGMSKGFRTSPYPAANLLRTLKNENAKIILSSDSHHKDTLSFHFSECRAILRDIGFSYVYAYYNGEFVKERI